MGSAPVLSVIAAQARLSASDVFSFLSSNRVHIKQGILCTSADTTMEGKVTMPVEVVTALSGAALPHDLFLKLQGTVVMEVLGEDGVTAVEQAAGDAPPRSPAADEEDGDDGDDAEPLESSAEGSVARLTDAARSPPAEDGGEGGPHFGTAAVVPVMELKDISPFFGRSRHASGEAKGAGDQINEGALVSTLAHVPYKSEVEFVEDAFQIIALLINIRNADGVMKDEDDATATAKPKMEASLRGMRRKVRVSSAVHRARLEATLKEGRFVPRVEQLSRRLGLTEVEKLIVLLMVGTIVSHDVLVAINGRYVMRDGQRIMTVGYILFVLCDGLMERVVGRKAFYRSAPLIANGIVTIFADNSRMLNTDLTEYFVDIDRTIVDSLMGMDTETSEIVPGSQLYMPSVPFEHVALPTATTNLVLSTIEHYGLFEKCKKQCGFAEKMGTSNTGLVILFYGPSGTGKTMLANAVAHNMKKRILVVNFSQFKSDLTAAAVMRFLFREAKLNDAIIFFDECETLFESRDNNSMLTSVLTEFEKYDGIVLMSTNRAQNMDDAMNRRISLMIEFKLPDCHLRKRIWTSHVPATLKLAENVSLDTLANNYELSGGLIRNAVLAAIRTAVARENTDTPTLTAEDFDAGARQQLRGFFLAAERQNLVSGHAYVTPRRSLAQLVVESGTRHQVELIAHAAKSRTALFAQWGFNEEACQSHGTLYVFHGPSGTGKSLAVEGIAYECGAIVRVCNIMEQLLLQQNTIRAVFEEGRQLGAVIAFDEAQQLFDYTDRSQQIAQLIYYYAMQYPRPVIIIATTTTSGGGLDLPAVRLKFTQVIAFRTPSRELREALWRKAFPPLVPLADDVDFAELGTAAVSAKTIDAVVFSACGRAVAQSESGRQVTMKLLREELELAMARERTLNPSSNMFA
ncbi:AAA ATPase [Strigomonas culicis]|uniref:AAA ATPase n=1 Tax=Strigomonas culicis TaxID=28005 RepID=S9UFZ1_9TRYP|nr:AAA ATPase [Strigomonas culicis]|eukprot:EPY27619.1 AAA ATPase [Strigomonas culicis]